jgi:hypothetical protein
MALVGHELFLNHVDSLRWRCCCFRRFATTTTTSWTMPVQWGSGKSSSSSTYYESVQETTGGFVMGGGIVSILTAFWLDSLVAEGTFHGVLSPWSQTMGTTMESIRMAFSNYTMAVDDTWHSAMVL